MSIGIQVQLQRPSPPSVFIGYQMVGSSNERTRVVLQLNEVFFSNLFIFYIFLKVEKKKTLEILNTCTYTSVTLSAISSLSIFYEFLNIEKK